RNDSLEAVETGGGFESMHRWRNVGRSRLIRLQPQAGFFDEPVECGWIGERLCLRVSFADASAEIVHGDAGDTSDGRLGKLERAECVQIPGIEFQPRGYSDLRRCRGEADQAVVAQRRNGSWN